FFSVAGSSRGALALLWWVPRFDRATISTFTSCFFLYPFLRSAGEPQWLRGPVGRPLEPDAGNAAEGSEGPMPDWRFQPCDFLHMAFLTTNGHESTRMIPDPDIWVPFLSSRAKSRIERLGMPRDGREGRRLSEREASESNLSIFL